MESEQKPMSSSFLDRLKEATGVVATKAREGVEELQTKHELSQAYNDAAAAAHATHRDRFVGLAMLPMQAPEKTTMGYPKSGLRENVGRTSETMPMAGKMRM